MKTHVEDLFHDLVDRPVEARHQYYAEHSINVETRREVEELLAFDSEASTIPLARDIAHAAQRILEPVEPGQLHCGPYRLGRLLGCGGMGAVYAAERVDGEVTHRVAVKLLRPGLDDSRLRERFLAERQILANLSHPNIAILLDAGHLETGQPYLAMEYVEGKPIDLHAAELPIRDKIALFLKVCSAVSYLHHNLIVHRDLKPANILVNEAGEPKLLDFGIAKILDLTTEATATGWRMLTPDYASPEQVEGKQVSTATDVYSLGAVLYKLLTGVSPHHFESDSVPAIALAISRGQITLPSKVNRVLKGDLDIIVMKALRKEPHERYATVEQLADDLENFLESRPIRARKGDIWYRTRKFARRYWLPMSAVGLAVSGLAAGVLVANQERAVAQKRFAEVRQLANKLFDIDTEVRKLPGSTKVRQLIVDTSLQYLNRLSTEVHHDPDLALEMGNAYMRVARVQGVPVSANLGQMDRAEQNLKIAHQFVQSVLAAQPANREAMLRAAQIAHDRMVIAQLSGRENEALALADESAQWLDKYHATLADRHEMWNILNVYTNLADQYETSRRYDEADRLSRRAIEFARQLNHQAYLGTILQIPANVARDTGRLDEALSYIRESARILRPPDSKSELGRFMNYSASLIYEARILGESQSISFGRSNEAVILFSQAFELIDGFVHQDTKDQNSRTHLALAGIGMADLLRHTDPKRSLAVYDHLLGHLGEIKDNSSFRRFEVNALAGSSYPLWHLGRRAEARQRLDAAMDLMRQLKAYPATKWKPGSEPEIALCALANYYAESGNVHAAIAIYREVLAAAEAWDLKPQTSLAMAVKVSPVYTGYAALLRRAGQPELASSIEHRRLELWRVWQEALPGNAFVTRQFQTAAHLNVN